MKRDFSEEVTAHVERARQSLKAARTLLEKGLYDDAASRAYYAAFHAASAALMQRGLTLSKHRSLLGGVNKSLGAFRHDQH